MKYKIKQSLNKSILNYSKTDNVHVTYLDTVFQNHVENDWFKISHKHFPVTEIKY